MSSNHFDEKQREVLARHAIGLVDWYALTCPGYEDHSSLDDMASWTVHEIQAARGTHEFTAEDYRAALLRLIDRGWLAVYTEDDVERELARLLAAGAPLEAFFLPWAGSVAFTENGWFAHRQIAQEIQGPECIASGERQIWCDKPRSELRISAHTAEAAERWMQMQVWDSRFECDGVAINIRVGTAEPCGPWWASRFLRHERGFMIVVRYDVIPRWTVTHHELAVEYTVERMAPFFASGTIGGVRFLFHESSAVGLDGVRCFKWHLTMPASRHSRTIDEPRWRTQPLSAEQADVLIRAIQRWVISHPMK